MENTGEPGCPSLPRGNEVFFYHWRPVESQDFHHHSAITRLPHPPTHSVCHSPKPGWHQRRQTRESELLFLPSSDKEPTRMDGHTHTHTHTLTYSYLVVTKQHAPLFTQGSSVRGGLLNCKIK